MKNYLVASALACAVLSSSAFAADGVINFTGKIINNACVVNPTLNVQMGDVAATDFKKVGDESGSRAFDLELKDCPVNLKNAKVTLDGAADANNAELFKLNDAGATGLALRIERPGNKAVIPGSSTADIPLSEGNNLLPFVAAYKSTDKVTAGDANATLQFSISYN
ncbi:Fimbrial subunit ElfA precursor [Serratia entomophila]|uniref:Fimbrial subunit ElfA n=1 Tax=Serratia ficaria TaxID=61651 RepID=A0A240CAQ7_SERFI|nr:MULTISPECIES: fimbrial protein [Serratia]REF43183.1 major type 1 subunit fimbrin (pilin) [Serratia ficaria]UIW17673.1 fimbrial protein [Serratia entomophila]CAI0789214.1 Fimbrial subunit ElfA precursor [Serratia ficaria]CAI0882233.1 Fimbrial subunit ElfA precursor [Serratia ficaria]CAI0973619.1 Fimbrial subunit ElfA precursor [Serratia entomophila]